MVNSLIVEMLKGRNVYLTEEGREEIERIVQTHGEIQPSLQRLRRCIIPRNHARP